MGLIEVNGHGVIDGRLTFPRSGVWHADLRVDTLEALSGPVTVSIADGRLVLKGTVSRGAEYVDTGFVRIVAGADGLRKVARARSYNQTSLRIILRDLLGGAGEILSPTADSATLSRQLAAWTTAALSTGVAFTSALSSASPGASWRALPDGTIWVGPETWPDSGFVPDDYQILDEEPRQLFALVGMEAPLLLPGTTLAGRRISRVEHDLDGVGLRSSVWFEDAETGSAPPLDRLTDAFGAAIRGSIGSLVYNAQHFARVISQNGDTIDVEIENPTIAKFLPSMQKVPLMKPAPGATLQMKAAGRVLIGWSGGDPARPYALAYDAGTSVSKLVLNGDLVVVGGEVGAEPPPLGTTYRKAEDVYLKAISTGVAAALGALGLAAAVSALTTADGAWAAAAPTFLAKKTKVS